MDQVSNRIVNSRTIRRARHVEVRNTHKMETYWRMSAWKIEQNRIKMDRGKTVLWMAGG
jgi:hypothetical protein